MIPPLWNQKLVQKPLSLSEKYVGKMNAAVCSGEA
jgi:hypothetical protein